MKIIDMDAEQVMFPDIAVNTVFTSPNGEEVYLKLDSVMDGRFNAYNVTRGRSESLYPNCPVIPREAEIRHWRKGGVT